jgi:hypothetical protein
MLGRFDRGDYEARVRHRRGFVVFLTVIPAFLIMFFQSPVWMVKVGGIAQSLMLPVIALATLHMRHTRLPGSIRPGAFVTAGLWVSSIVMMAAVGYGVLTGR